MSRSIHDRLEKVRKPRVHIKYTVETEGAVEEKSLPFIVGVLGDFSGHPTAPLPPLRDRKFTLIDRDNFDKVMASMKAGLTLRVPNTLVGDGSEIAVQLQFTSMDDLEPAKVVAQVPALRKLLETRTKLRDLLTKVDRSDSLENLLEQILQSPDLTKKIADQLPKPA